MNRFAAKARREDQPQHRGGVRQAPATAGLSVVPPGDRGGLQRSEVASTAAAGDGADAGAWLQGEAAAGPAAARAEGRPGDKATPTAAKRPAAQQGCGAAPPSLAPWTCGALSTSGMAVLLLLILLEAFAPSSSRTSRPYSRHYQPQVNRQPVMAGDDQGWFAVSPREALRPATRQSVGDLTRLLDGELARGSASAEVLLLRLRQIKQAPRDAEPKQAPAPKPAPRRWEPEQAAPAPAPSTCRQPPAPAPEPRGLAQVLWSVAAAATGLPATPPAPPEPAAAAPAQAGAPLRQRPDIIGLDDPIEFAPLNPKQVGSIAYKRYEKYKAARTAREALAHGALTHDINFDLKQGYCKRRVGA